MANKEKKLGYLAAWKLNLRAWGIWRKLCPQVFVSLLLSSVVKAVTPYVTIFLSARIIDELSGARRPDQLLRWVVLTLACTAACALLQGVLTRWSNYARDCAGQLDDQIYMDKMVALDYADVDRQAVFDLYSQIRQNENWSGWGLPKVISFFESFVTAVVQVLGGVGLSVSLFLSPVPAGSSLAFLNHPHSTGEGCSAVFFLIFRPSVSPLCYPFLVVHLVHGSRAPIIEPRAKMGSHQRGGWGPVPRIEYIISGGRAQGEGTAEGLALPPR